MYGMLSHAKNGIQLTDVQYFRLFFPADEA